MINDLISKAENEYETELATTFKEIAKKFDLLRHEAVKIYPDIPRGKDDLDSGTISIYDARLLYILVRTLKPKVIFEIGTWIGTSAMMMAEAMRKNDNGGKIYTCDVNTFYSVDNSYADIITPINAFSDDALDQIPPDSKIDFVFTDGELTFKTIAKLKPKLSPEAVIATHDFVLPAEKGVLNFVRMQLLSLFGYTYFFPQEIKKDAYNSGVIGALYKKTFSFTNLLQSFIFTIYFGTKALFVKLFRKLSRVNI
jgi:predicted O-methyltransferase YrrM